MRNSSYRKGGIMRKIVVLEDDASRMSLLAKAFIHDNLVITNNAKTALSLLDTNKVDLIMLDHDLGGEVFVDVNNENTGSYLVKNISDLNKDTTVIVHSMNTVAGKAMVETLTSKGFTTVGYYPFSLNLFKQFPNAINN